jgi:hypothetical protein
MAKVLVSASSGCRVFGETGERETELGGRRFSAMSLEVEGTCLAVVDQHEIWRREHSPCALDATVVPRSVA